MPLSERPLYRMPVFFGPSLGPRQGLDRKQYDNKSGPLQTTVTACFEADLSIFERYLPKGLRLRGVDQIVFSFSYIREIKWLGGRGYNTFGVNIPAAFSGEKDNVSGDLCLVLWENMADPIITGREELGFSKIFCTLPDLQRSEQPSAVRATASWEGFEFAAFDMRDLEEAPVDESSLPQTGSEGLLHWKYIPATGDWGSADADYATFTPGGAPDLKVLRRQKAAGASLTWRKGNFTQLPTLKHIVDTFADLSVGQCLGAEVIETRGYKDLSDQRRLT